MKIVIKLVPGLVPGPCRFISRRRLNVPSYVKAEQKFLNWLFPEGLPEPVKNPPPKPNRPPRPLRRPPFGRRWNDPIEALFSAINDPPPKPPFPYGRCWRNQREPQWNRAQMSGQKAKSQWRRLNDPSFLKDEQKALNMLFPEGVPQPDQPPPPRLVENPTTLNSPPDGTPGTRSSQRDFGQAMTSGRCLFSIA